jgi:hypothetical protein
VQREKEITECREAIAEESTDHVHIRRKAIATNFSEQLRDGLTDYSVVSIDIYEWDYGELMETLRHDLQKELSTLWYYYSRIKSVGLSAFGGGANAGVETRPDYSRVSDYLGDIAEDTHNGLVVYIDYHGTDSVDGFGWISKLCVPEDATIVTEGFRECQLDSSEEVGVGRLSQAQTVEYLTDRYQRPLRYIRYTMGIQSRLIWLRSGIPYVILFLEMIFVSYGRKSTIRRSLGKNRTC